MILRARDLAFSFGSRAVLAGISLDLAPGEFLAIIGPNGAGKSTLLRLLSGFLSPDAGEVRCDDRALQSLPDAQRARFVGHLPQRVATHFPFTALEMVAMGAVRDTAGLLRTAQEEAAGLQALEQVRAAHLAARPFPALSGGEQRLVLVARALAQDPEVLLLDEPTEALDVAHADRVLRLLRQRAASGRAIAAVLHDLNLALAWCTRFVLLHDRGILFDGAAEDLVASAALDRAYGIPFAHLRHPETRAPVVAPGSCCPG